MFKSTNKITYLLKLQYTPQNNYKRFINFKSNTKRNSNKYQKKSKGSLLPFERELYLKNQNLIGTLPFKSNMHLE